MVRISPGPLGKGGNDRVIDGRFQVREMVSSGGMGAVYRAHDMERDVEVAVKVAFGTGHVNTDERFLREATALSMLDHPNIVAYVAHGQTEGGLPYVAMDWLTGCDLGERLSRAPLSEAETLIVAAQICSALGAVHRTGILHRDLKPTNLFLVNGRLDQLRLLDFGLARIGRDGAELTKAGTILGTPAYIAPEQARSHGAVDERSDLYSLGAVLFACMTGRPPFVSNKLLAQLTKLLLEPAPPLSDRCAAVSPAFEKLVARLLSKSPAKRPASADEVRDLLRKLDTVTPDIAEPVTLQLSHLEQSYFSVLLVSEATSHGNGDEDSAKLLADAEDSGARIYQMTNGATVAVFATESLPSEMGLMAVRFAFDRRRQYADTDMVVATGRGSLDDRNPVGEVIDRAARLLGHGTDETLLSAEVWGDSPARLVIDDVTAGLVSRRFELMRKPGGAYVVLGQSGARADSQGPLGNRTTCVGRERELGTLESIFDECLLEQSSGVVLVTGATGMGKSRVAQEFVKRLRARGDAVQIWTAYGDPVHAGASFGLLGQLLRRALSLPASDSLERRRAIVRAHVASSVPPGDRPRLCAFLGELVATPFPEGNMGKLRDARRDARLMHDQMRFAWEEWLEVQCRRQPLVLVLEDIHWSDGPSLRFIDAALRNLEDCPFLVLALGTPDVHERFPDLWRARGVELLPLKPLSKRACARLAREALPTTIGETTIERLSTQAAGNPFYLEELLRASATGDGSDIPDTILATAGVRLRKLSSDERRVLRAASIFGREFWVEGVAELLDQDLSSVASILTALEAQELVTRGRRSRFPQLTTYRFRHELVRQAVHATFTPDDEARANRLCGVWLRDVGEPEPMVLAEYFWRGGDKNLAMQYFHQAARQALKADSLLAAVAGAERALACGAEGKVKGELHLLQAEANNWQGHHDSALSAGLQALEFIDTTSDDWAHAVHHVAWASHATGDLERLEWVAQKLRETMSHQPSDPWVAAMSICATLLSSVQKTAQAEKLRRIVKLYVDHFSPGRALIGTVARSNSMEASFACEWGRAARLIGEAVDVWNELGDERNACHDLVNLGCALCQLGQYERSIGVLRDALARAHRVGLNIDRFCNSNLAVALTRHGQLRAARAIFAALDDNDSNHFSVAVNAIYQAQLALLDAQPFSAIDLTVRAINIAERDSFTPTLAFAMAVKAQALLAMNLKEDALATAERAMETLTEIGRIDEGDMLVRLIHAQTLQENGQEERARNAFARARSELLARAERIEHPEWRASFLENVAEHRRILELAEASAPK